MIANTIIAGVSLLLYNPLMKLWEVMHLSLGASFALQLVSVVLIDGIIYLITLFLLKEDLVYSFSRKRREERENAES